MDRLINIQYKDGKVSRIPRSRADDLVGTGKASFISKTRYKAAQAGVAVTEDMSDAEVKKKIRATAKPEKEEKKETEEKEQQRRRKKDRRKDG
jgi:hypothetical protein